MVIPFIHSLTYSFDSIYCAPLWVSHQVLSLESLIGEHRWAWPEGMMWQLGEDEVDKVGRRLGSRKLLSDLGFGNIILGFENDIMDGQKGSTESGWGCSFCLGVCFSLTSLCSWRRGRQAEPSVAGGASSLSFPSESHAL